MYYHSRNHPKYEQPLGYYTHKLLLGLCVSVLVCGGHSQHRHTRSQDIEIVLWRANFDAAKMARSHIAADAKSANERGYTVSVLLCFRRCSIAISTFQSNFNQWHEY